MPQGARLKTENDCAQRYKSLCLILVFAKPFFPPPLNFRLRLPALLRSPKGANASAIVVLLLCASNAAVVLV